MDARAYMFTQPALQKGEISEKDFFTIVNTILENYGLSLGTDCEIFDRGGSHFINVLNSNMSKEQEIELAEKLSEVLERYEVTIK